MIDQQLVEPHFQGLVNFYTEDYFAFESLIRVSPSLPAIRPDQLFSMAENEGYLLEFDRLCVLQAITAFSAYTLPGYLFVNILPINLGKILPTLTLSNDSSPLKGIVFEISEKHPLPNLNELKEYIKTLRQHGALIAIDDLGAGHSGLITWAEIKPDFVKIDRHFISHIHNDSIKREFVRSIVEISKGLRCKVIAEGIESIEELNALHHLGIHLGQGFLLHRPEKSPAHIFRHKRFFSVSSKFQQHIHIRHSETAESLIESVTAIPPNTHAAVVNDIFQRTPNLRCLPIVNESIPIGIISRTSILETFSGRYSYPLHGNKEIRDFMDNNPIIVDHLETLHGISTKVTDDESTDLNADFIITKNNHYCGVGKVSTLLRLLTNLQIKRARHSNPLTLLPGNIPIYEHIEDLIAQQQTFHLAYIDINHFKPFNDYFSFSAGDEVIKQLADIIMENCSSKLEMVGHIGGDDFVVIFRSNDWEKKCRRILTNFQMFTLKYYSKEEIAQQGIWYQDRKGEPRFFQLLSLAIGVVKPDLSHPITHHDVAELATKAKKQAKLTSGNHLFISPCHTHSYGNESLTH
jgi:diguanylate cyclase (GGDEF)-like protein